MSQRAPMASPADGGILENADRQEALARLQYVVDSGRRLGLLLGPSGSGKSLLLEAFEQQVLCAGHPCARLSLLGMEPIDLVSALAWSLRAEIDQHYSLHDRWLALDDRLGVLAAQGRRTVLLLDDVDAASPVLRQHVLRLAAGQSSVGQLSLILAADGEQLEQLPRRLRELVDLRIDLHCWQADDIEHCLRRLRAGHPRAALFSPEAIARLERLTAGVPRRVCQVADLALLAAAGQHREEVDAHIIQSVFDELAVACGNAAG